MKTLIEIEDARVAALDALARKRGTSRSALVREAVDALLEGTDRSSAESAFGLWKEIGEDGLAYQRRLRAEW